jgi:hypothetical protein
MELNCLIIFPLLKNLAATKNNFAISHCDLTVLICRPALAICVNAGVFVCDSYVSLGIANDYLSSN